MSENQWTTTMAAEDLRRLLCLLAVALCAVLLFASAASAKATNKTVTVKPGQTVRFVSPNHKDKTIFIQAFIGDTEMTPETLTNCKSYFYARGVVALANTCDDRAWKFKVTNTSGTSKKVRFRWERVA